MAVSVNAMESLIQPRLDSAVLQQIHEFADKTHTLPTAVVNEAVRYWLDTIATPTLEALGLEPLTPRFDGSAAGRLTGGGSALD